MDEGCDDQTRADDPSLSGNAVGLDVTSVGEPDAGDPHVRFDERGVETQRGQSIPPPRHSSSLPIHAFRRRGRDRGGAIRQGALLRPAHHIVRGDQCRADFRDVEIATGFGDVAQVAREDAVGIRGIDDGQKGDHL